MAFDPNEYLKSGPIETEGFDPNAYLGIKKKKGLGAALERGTRGLLGSLQTGIESILPEENAAANAAIKGVQRQEQIAQELEAPASLDRVKEAYRKKGFLSAAGEVASQIPGAIAEQVPQLGAMYAGARLGSRAGPWGAVIGAAAVPLAQFYGSNLQRQAAEQISTDTPVDVNRGKAAIAAAPQAALDIVQQRLVFGSKLFSKALGIPEGSLVKQSAAQVEKLAQEKLLPTLLKGTAKGVAAEIPTEIGQQMIERAQAGLALTSPDALAEYGETAYQVGLLGPLGAVGRISDKSAARAEVAGRQAADAAILADQQNQVQPPVGGMAPITPGAPIATPPATIPTLFEPTELPAQLTPDEIAGQTLAGKPVVAEALPLEQQRISELERNIEALVQQNTPEALAKAEALKQQLPETPEAKTFRLGEEMMQLERKYKELEVQRDETRALKDKEPLSLQMNAIRERQNEILNEGKVLEREGVDLEPAEGLFAVEGKRKPQVAEQAELLLEPAAVVDEATLDTFGVTKAAPIRKKLLGLDMTKPEDREVFKDEVDKHTIKKAKIDMPAVDQYFNYFEEAPSEPGTISDVGTRANQPGLPLPSGQPTTAPGTTTLATPGLAGAIPATGGPATGTGAVDQTGQGALAPTPKIQGELQGKATIDLADRITQGDLKGALQDIANSKQYSQLDNLVAKRLLQAKTLPKVEIVSLEVTGGYPAQYDPNTDTVQITAGNIDSHTVLHETVHGFLHVMIRQSEAREARGLGGNARLNSLKDVYNHVKAKRPDLVNKYGMKDLSEFASEVMSNPDFQNDLRNTPYRRSNVFTEFARAVLRAMGIGPDKSGIADIDSLAGALMAAEGALSTGRKIQEDVQGGVRQQVGLDIAKQDEGAFKKWFGDSKVVNEDGSPMVVYHGTTQDIRQFKMSKEGSLGAGIYMTPSTEFANSYAEQEGANVLPVYASIEKPLIINTVDRRFDPAVDLLVALGVKREKAEAIVEKASEDKGGITKEVMARAQKQGYDGIMQYRDGMLMEVVAFSPYQVKSAIGNTGEFSRATADIAKVAPPQNLVDLYKKMSDANEAANRWNYGATKRNATMASRQYLRAMEKATGTNQTTSPEYLTVHQAVINEYERQQGFDIPKVQRTPQGSQAEADMLAFGGKAEPKEQSFIDRQKDKFNASKAKWQENYELNNDWVPATFGKMQNIASFDQAFNNRLYNHFNNLKKQGVMTMQQVESALIRISISQAVHRGNLANQIIDRGNYTYDAVTNRWNSVEDPINMKAFEGLIRSLATKLGVDPNRARQIMGAAYEANRLQSMYQDLDTATKELAQAETDLKTIKDPKLKATKKKLIDALKGDVESLTDKVQHKNPAQVEAGMRLYNSHPEIQEGTKVWNTMRERVVKMLVETGVKTPEQAEAWLDEAAYVPFFRDMEEEKAIGPQIMSRGMRESMKDYGMKGSMRDVNDPIENMYQWMQWSIARAISNKQLQVMVDSYRDALPSEVRDGKGVNGKTFAIYRDGVQKFYNVDDAAVAQAFMGLEPVVFPAIKYFANTSNFLRHAVTRMPLFPVVQVFNDSYNAMFVSGLKNPFGLLKEIAKEVVATTRGTSQTRNTLIQAGILETQDYNALNEAEAIGQRLNLNEPGAWTKLARNLDRFSSASDNVIRQGIYNQSRKEGLSHEAAMEKAAEVVNFRRISSNETMQLLSRIVPFFNAYTQVASVAVKTLTGRGISPQERDVAAKTLLATTTKVMLLSMLYSMAIGDDEDYQKKNRVSRDRMFMIPGSGGFGIPIRMDAFAIPKLAGEYGYQLMSDSMFTDSKMFREAMSRAIRGSIMPPSEGVPQLVRPALGVMMNYDAFQDREIINATMRRLDPDRQYTKTTSEMAKALGAMTGMSPLNIDFLLRGYLGSVATLSALATNDVINAARGGPPRPDQSIGNIISSLPNMGAMMSKEENTAVLTDFYEVARDVNKAVDTLNSMKYASPEARKAYMEEHKKELALKSQVQAINKQLTVLRRREQMVRESPETRMSAEQKQAELKRINEMRSRMTQNVMRIRQKLYE
jgi:hypothetical protein